MYEKLLLWKYGDAYVGVSSVTQSCLTLCDPVNRSTPGLPVHHHLPEFTQTSIESMPSSHRILCHPLFLLPPIPPSIRVFSSESTLHITSYLVSNPSRKMCLVKRKFQKLSKSFFQKSQRLCAVLNIWTSIVISRKGLEGWLLVYGVFSTPP